MAYCSFKAPNQEILNLVRSESAEKTEELASQAAEYLKDPALSLSSNEEVGRMDGKSQKRRRELSDLFPSTGQVPNFVKKQKKLKKLKADKKSKRKERKAQVSVPFLLFIIDSAESKKVRIEIFLD